MYFAILLQKGKTQPEDAFIVAYTATGKTAQEAASKADLQAEGYTKSYPNNAYRVVVGKVTHEVEQPVRKVVLVPVND